MYAERTKLGCQLLKTYFGKDSEFPLEFQPPQGNIKKKNERKTERKMKNEK